MKFLELKLLKLKCKYMDNQNWFVHVGFLIVFTTLIIELYLLDAKIERQGQRTDRLYEMFIDLVKVSCQKNNQNGKT